MNASDRYRIFPRKHIVIKLALLAVLIICFVYPNTATAPPNSKPQSSIGKHNHLHLASNDEPIIIPTSSLRVQNRLAHVLRTAKFLLHPQRPHPLAQRQASGQILKSREDNTKSDNGMADLRHTDRVMTMHDCLKLWEPSTCNYFFGEAAEWNAKKKHGASADGQTGASTLGQQSEDASLAHTNRTLTMHDCLQLWEPKFCASFFDEVDEWKSKVGQGKIIEARAEPSKDVTNAEGDALHHTSRNITFRECLELWEPRTCNYIFGEIDEWKHKKIPSGSDVESEHTPDIPYDLIGLHHTLRNITMHDCLQLWDGTFCNFIFSEVAEWKIKAGHVRRSTDDDDLELSEIFDHLSTFDDFAHMLDDEDVKVCLKLLSHEKCNELFQYGYHIVRYTITHLEKDGRVSSPQNFVVNDVEHIDRREAMSFCLHYSTAPLCDGIFPMAVQLMAKEMLQYLNDPAHDDPSHPSKTEKLSRRILSFKDLILGTASMGNLVGHTKRVVDVEAMRREALDQIGTFAEYSAQPFVVDSMESCRKTVGYQKCVMDNQLLYHVTRYTIKHIFNDLGYFNLPEDVPSNDFGDEDRKQAIKTCSSFLSKPQTCDDYFAREVLTHAKIFWFEVIIAHRPGAVSHKADNAARGLTSVQVITFSGTTPIGHSVRHPLLSTPRVEERAHNTLTRKSKINRTPVDYLLPPEKCFKYTRHSIERKHCVEESERSAASVGAYVAMAVVSVGLIFLLVLCCIRKRNAKKIRKLQVEQADGDIESSLGTSTPKPAGEMRSQPNGQGYDGNLSRGDSDQLATPALTLDGANDGWSKWILRKSRNEKQQRKPLRTPAPRLPSLKLPKPTFATIRRASGLEPVTLNREKSRTSKSGRGRLLRWNSTY